jgi:glycosyltransferase involved in cell wall biosynthesis
MALKLIEKGIKVTMVCGSVQGGITGVNGRFKNGMRKGHVDGIEVIELNVPYSNKMRFLIRTYYFILFSLHSIRLALFLNYDIIFATSTPLTAGVPGIFAKIFRRKRFVFEVRDLWPELPKAMGVIKNPIILGLMSILERVTYHVADKIIGLSPGICKGIHRRGISESKIDMVPNGSDNTLFDLENKVQKIKVTSDKDIVFVYAGAHGIANGLEAILYEEEELNRREFKGYKFLLIGDGMKKDNLVKFANKKNLRNIIFQKPISKEEMPDFLFNYDVGMQILANVPAFYYGTSPNKFFDYLAAGLPVLTNYPGWVADLITENDCGFVIQPDNSIDFADMVEDIIKNKDNLIEKSINSKNLALTQFDRDKLAEKWVKIVL